MANQVTLMAYLQRGLPAITVNEPTNPGGNTTNSAYEADDIQDVRHWTQFNITSVRQRYQNVLTATTLPLDPFPTSPPHGINSETGVRARIIETVNPRVRRGLRAIFNQLHTTGQLDGLTPLSLDIGEAATTPNGFKPDIAYFVVGLAVGAGSNRAPGDVKPGYKWNTGMATEPGIREVQFRQALSQVNWYMRQHRTRYGFIITNLELVAIRRLDDHGNLELSAPIPWENQGTVQQPRLTVLMALWYLGMLAAQDQGADRWQLE